MGMAGYLQQSWPAALSREECGRQNAAKGMGSSFPVCMGRSAAFMAFGQCPNSEQRELGTNTRQLDLGD